MDWTVKIAEKPNMRIKVWFEPKLENIHFSGQYKPKNGTWVEFSEVIIKMETDLEEIQHSMAQVYDLMKKRVDAFIDLENTFTILHDIEIKDEGEVEIK